MARGRRKAPTPEEEAVEEDVQQEMDVDDQARPLEFDEALTWRPGKAIPVADLLRRLKELHEELQGYEQEDAHRKTLEPKAQELASAQLIGHKDKGVKAHAMLCIVEMFRILAPDAPYKGSQLKDIFTLFTTHIVPALAHPSDPYNHQHVNILQSLTTVKSVILLTDVPGSDTLILNLFANCFDVMSGSGRAAADERLPKNLEYHMTNMLTILVEETEALPSGVIDTVLAQFLRADPNALSSGKKGASQPSQVLLEVSPAYSMARTVCNSTGEKMGRAIGNYFSAVLIDASEVVTTSKPRKPAGKKRTHGESEDDESDDGMAAAPAEDELREVEKAHRLLRELWRSCPDVVINIVPLIEVELGGESPHLRVMAVETLGDMIAGIGAAGPPPSVAMEPAAYPSQSLGTYSAPQQRRNILLDPAAPHAFSSVYPNAYHQFVGRSKDKAAPVRTAWVTAVARIIYTSGGGKGLDESQERSLLSNFASLLREDNDEKVRLEAINAVGRFDFAAIVQKFVDGGSSKTNVSIIEDLIQRIRDVKSAVRNAAIELLARIWGVASGAIAEGNERLRECFGPIPSKIFDAWSVNASIRAHIHRALYDSLLPLTYPPIKPGQTNQSDSQRIGDSQASSGKALDPDAIRAERVLVLLRDLDKETKTKAKPIFFGIVSRRRDIAKYVEAYLGLCEELNSNKGSETPQKLPRITGALATSFQLFPDEALAREHLEKFANHHDRRSFQLIRFCYAPESDYRKIFKATKELTKRLEEAPSGIAAVLETILPLARAAAILVYNRSHVPAIVQFSRTDDKGLAAPAHEVLKEMSTKAPEVFKVHVHELCETLKKQKPSDDSEVDPSVVDTLKACAGFAQRFPGDMPKDRDFYRSMVAYAVHGSPPKAAKHAVTVIVSSAERKQMYIKEILQACSEKFEYGSEGFLSRLAALSQLRLLANQECEDHDDVILGIAINEVLGQVRAPASEEDPKWADSIDDELCAKLWSLRILVNGLRGIKEDSGKSDEQVAEAASTVYSLLNTVIRNEGDLSKTSSTPAHHASRLQLAAAIQILKLSRDRRFDTHLSNADFNNLTSIVQNAVQEVRAGFNRALKKYLATEALAKRFYPLVFLYAFEPDKEMKAGTENWLKFRTNLSAKRGDGVIEGVFTRYLSLLAHHPDFSPEPTDLEDSVDYIVFYLKNAATKENLPLIYQVAQRHKQVQDAIDPSKSENLYILADISEAVIRQFADLHGWSLQLVPHKLPMPSTLYQKLSNHAIAQEIAQKNYIPVELAEDLEDLVKKLMKAKSKKRKPDNESAQASKKAKAAKKEYVKKAAPKRAAKPAKTPKKRKTSDETVPTTDRRKSSRGTAVQNYADAESSDDDEQLEEWQGVPDDDENDGEANKENRESNTPPTSDPARPSESQREAARKPAAKRGAAREGRSQPNNIAKGKLATRAKGRARGEEKDEMSVPSDSDGELSDPPSEMET